MAKLRRIRVLPAARLAALLGGFAGLSAGMVYSLGGVVVDVLVEIGLITNSEIPGVAYGTALAFLALIGMPIVIFAIGAIAAFLAAIMYNSLAGRIGAWAHIVVGQEVLDIES